MKSLKTILLFVVLFGILIPTRSLSTPPNDLAQIAPFQSQLGIRFEDWLAKKGDHAGAIAPDYDDSKWRPVKIGQTWKDSSTCWFRTKFTVPESEDGKALFFEIGVDDAAMVYIDGEQVLQLSGFGSVLLTQSAVGGQTYSVAVRAVNTGGAGALTIAAYRTLTSEKLITIENALAKLDKLKSVNTMKLDDWLYNASGGKASADPGADTSDWASVYVPHSIPPEKAYGWYRATITIPEKINGFDYLDGPAYFDFTVRTKGDLYVNGKKKKSFQEHFQLGIPDGMKPGTEVVLALKVSDLSGRGSLRSAYLKTTKLDEIVALANDLAKKLETAKLLLDQHPSPPEAIFETVDKVAADIEQVIEKTETESVIAQLKGLVASMSTVDDALADFPLFHQGPYLQNAQSDSMTIMWETIEPAPSAVYYGKDSLDNVVKDDELKTIHELIITGLEPETTYKYMAVSSKLAAPESTFKTVVKYDTPFVFAVWGDSRTDYKSHESVIDAMIPHKPDIALNVGDVVSSGIHYDQWAREHFLPIRRLGINTPTYIAIGNHEYGGYGYGNPVVWFEKFVSHAAPNDYYFSFTYGNSYFMILNPQDEPGIHQVREGTEQHTWMMNEFESDTYKNAEFKFVFFHEPPYSECWSGGYYDGEPNIRAKLVPLFEKYGMDIVFAGHTHDYERGQYPKPDGPYYIIAGGGGASLDDTKYKEWKQIDVYEFKYHFIKVSIDGPKLVFEAIDRRGDIFDKFEINNE